MKNKSRAPNSSNPSPETNGDHISVGNITNSKAIAIGQKAIAIFIDLGSLIPWQTIITFFRCHFPFLTINIILSTSAIMLWMHYKDRFLIAYWVLFTGLLLLEGTLFGSYRVKRQPQKRLQLILLPGLCFVGLVGLTGFEYQQKVYPPQFEVDTFGVAVAQFGEGPNFTSTNSANEVSQLVLQRLMQLAADNHQLDFIKFKPIGIVRTNDEAMIEGKRINADLVIWGQLQVSTSGTTVNFSILETPDKVANPTFPRVIPMLETSATGMVELPGRNSEEITAEMTNISAFTFGLAHYFKWDFQSSAKAFQEALNADSENSPPYLYLLHFYYGSSLQWPGHIEEANEQFEAAIDAQSNDPAAYLALAIGLRSQGKGEEAEQRAQEAFDICTAILQKDSGNAIAFFNRAVANEILQDWKSALKDYSAAAQKNPDLFLAWIGQIRMYLVLGQIQEAIDMAQVSAAQVEENGGNAAWAYFYLAQAYDANGTLDNAQSAYEKAAQQAPKVDWIHFEVGKFYEKIGEAASAEQAYLLMIDVSSNKSWAYSVLADFYLKHMRFEEAVEEYEKALLLDPNSSQNRINSGIAHFNMGHINEARDEFIQAVERNPTNMFAHYVYGNFLESQGELEGAILQWETAQQIDPTRCDLLLKVGQTYAILGDYDYAGQMYKEALDSNLFADPDCRAKILQNLESLRPP